MIWQPTVNSRERGIIDNSQFIHALACVCRVLMHAGSLESTKEA